MTTQPNEHQQTIQHYLSILVGMCSEIKAGLTNEDYLRQLANDIDIDKINAALGWMDNLRDWWVVSTAVGTGVLMLECRITGKNGIVRNPTKEEWQAAFYAPSNPYRWSGGDERVEATGTGNKV